MLTPHQDLSPAAVAHKPFQAADTRASSVASHYQPSTSAVHLSCGVHPCRPSQQRAASPPVLAPPPTGPLPPLPSPSRLPAARALTVPLYAAHTACAGAPAGAHCVPTMSGDTACGGAVRGARRVLVTAAMLPPPAALPLVSEGGRPGSPGSPHVGALMRAPPVAQACPPQAAHPGGAQGPRPGGLDPAARGQGTAWPPQGPSQLMLDQVCGGGLGLGVLVGCLRAWAGLCP